MTAKMKKQSGGLFHFGKGGILRPCKAAEGNCPYGTIGQHFSDMDTGKVIADELNKRLVNMTEFGIATVGVHSRGSALVEDTIIRLANLQMSYERLTKIRDKARKDITKGFQELKEKGGEAKVKVGESTISLRKGYEKTVLDYDKLYRDLSEEELDIYESLVPVKEHSRLSEDFGRNEGEKKLFGRIKERVLTIGNEVATIRVEEKEDGQYALSPESMGQLHSFIEFDNKVKELEALQDALRSQLTETLREAQIDELRVGKLKVEYVPEQRRVRIDTEKLKQAGRYEAFSKTTAVAETITVRSSKKS